MATMNTVIIVVGLCTRKGIGTKSTFEMMEIPVEDLVAVAGICLAVFTTENIPPLATRL